MPTDLPNLSLRIPILIVTFCLSAFFSGSETALFSFQPQELKRMRDSKGADRLVAVLRSRPKRLLIVLLFGNMVVNVVFYSVSFVLWAGLEPRVGPTGVFLLGVASLLAIIVGGEVVPKNLAVTLYRPVGRLVALPLWLLQTGLLAVVYPLERIADFVVRLVGPADARGIGPEELEMLVQLGTREGVVDRGAGQMLAEVIGLSGVRIRELMVPRVEMVSFDLQDPQEKLLPLFRRAKLTAIPVYDGTMDNMLGVVHIKDVLFKQDGWSIRDSVRPIPFLPETATVAEALRYCQQELSKTAFVVDEYGAVEGLITVEDLLEEVVGEIADEYDAETRPAVQLLEDGRLRLQGRLSLRAWQELSGAEVPDLAVDTIGGLLMALLDRVPEVGDKVWCGGAEFTVEAVQGRRASRLLVDLHRDARPEGGPADA